MQRGIAAFMPIVAQKETVENIAMLQTLPQSQGCFGVKRAPKRDPLG